MTARPVRGGGRVQAGGCAGPAGGWTARLHRAVPRIRLAAHGCILLLACGWVLPSLAAPFEFTTPTALAGSLADPYAVHVEDVNGDGRDDVLVTDAGPSLQVHLQGASGILQAPLTHHLPIGSVRTMKVADIDRDGRPDVLVGHDTGIALRRGGSATWRYVWSLDECEVLDIADIDRDGWVDVACFGPGGYANAFYNDRSGGFSEPLYIHSPAYGLDIALVQMRLADVTGDGMPDLLTSSSAAPGFYVHRNDGTGAFLPAYGYLAPNQTHPGPHGLEVLDVDHDGIAEIITTSACVGDCRSVHVYRSDRFGHFTLSHELPSSDRAVGPRAYDVDRDGDLDLVVMHSGGSGGIARYEGSAAVGLSEVERKSLVPGARAGASAYALGDIDGDSCTDAVVSTLYGVRVLRGRCVARAASDFNGDGRSDVLWRNTSSGQNALWRSGNAATPQPINAVTDIGWQAAGAGDFDDDGRSDILWRHPANGRNVLWMAGDSRTQVGLAPLSSAWQVAGVADFDGDGTADILWRHGTSGQNMIWKAGHNAPAQVVATVTDLRWQVAGVGDFDGDGRGDILWRHSATGSNVVWRAADHARQLAVRAVTDLRWTVAGVADFDGDSHADILWRHALSGHNVIWRSASQARQQAVTAVTNMDWQAFAVADYSGDGRADILWRNPRSGANVIWRSANHATQASVASLVGNHWVVPGRR
jgi:hypothetical protein